MGAQACRPRVLDEFLLCRVLARVVICISRSCTCKKKNQEVFPSLPGKRKEHTDICIPHIDPDDIAQGARGGTAGTGSGVESEASSTRCVDTTSLFHTSEMMVVRSRGIISGVCAQPLSHGHRSLSSSLNSVMSSVGPTSVRVRDIRLKMSIKPITNQSPITITLSVLHTEYSVDENLTVLVHTADPIITHFPGGPASRPHRAAAFESH